MMRKVVFLIFKSFGWAIEKWMDLIIIVHICWEDARYYNLSIIVTVDTAFSLNACISQFLDWYLP